ncbi:hypothetical protein CHLRE_04g217220v5 [Chlamydomonas reinhardtii]|uniref:Uncharacterized protein n=1 Tax=Chlamydomonas reinhardtii TaxID=3055 RepID=A0A2K3DTC1_CHLRE|nr:uncharacterized protein CHLRE_04g217220v5 [Chlamydomonas reinhardtii]XP_042924982.1 uncharacterized protein CHLRE_04g217220v5 [Chlamydomonas reinhardtii]XP_042924983.1 uncharacterized protein CHLRE_04g217220v5 [Chlamydomonas reinhardtii]PNW83781.1 hypothetical protein CHLRE_04g217220v5 [Chlamydomonas reinhardtii]PNW83782.1 hypothetical protein CHLRE_04g217220v5 [Chlamydomonas reinhardtii]PNW83783.1 hypothetical protein CHLRE_04g217220v5 [Chlamydomonas reinhardtii]
MTASRRLYTQLAASAAEAASSGSRPLKIIGTVSAVGTALVLVSQWATGVQLDAFKKSMRADLKTELGAVRNDMNDVKTELGAMLNDIKTELGAMRNDMNDMKTELGAMRNDLKTALLGAMERAVTH